MMKLLLFELKKTILTKQFGLCLLALLLINTFYFSNTMKSNSIQDLKLYYLYENEVMLEKFYELHDEYDGTLTVEKAQTLISKYTELASLITNGTYSTEYSEDTITGYQFSDHTLLYLYFYEPMQYIAEYKSSIDEIIQEAKDNLQDLSEDSYSYRLNEFIISHYEGRTLSQFYNFEGWKAIMNYQFSDLLVVIMLMLGLLPTMIDERKNGMSSILKTTRMGYKKGIAIKILSIFILSIITIVIFSILNLGLAQLWIGLSGGDCPIYTLSSFSDTLFSVSIIQVYLFSQLCKVIGLFVLGCMLLGISKYSKDYLMAFIGSILVVIILLHIGGYHNADSYVLQLISTLSPFTLINNLSMLQNYSDMVVFDNLYMYANIAMIIQGIVGMVLIFILCKKWKRRKPLCLHGN